MVGYMQVYRHEKYIPRQLSQITDVPWLKQGTSLPEPSTVCHQPLQAQVNPAGDVVCSRQDFKGTTIKMSLQCTNIFRTPDMTESYHYWYEVEKTLRESKSWPAKQGIQSDHRQNMKEALSDMQEVWPDLGVPRIKWYSSENKLIQ